MASADEEELRSTHRVSRCRLKVAILDSTAVKVREVRKADRMTLRMSTTGPVTGAAGKWAGAFLTGGCSLPSSPCAGARRQSWPRSARVPRPTGAASASPTSAAATARRGSSTRPSTLAQYPGQIRQIAITGLGHDDPVLLVTNQMQARPADLVDRYARRMVIENQIAETIVPWLEGRALKLVFGTRNPSSVIPPPSVGIQASSLTTRIITGRPFGLSEMQSSGSKRIPWGRDRRQNVTYSASA